ncbi:Export control protein chs7 [Tolypocladium capitatum]|uniref:Export control protein chs7 n=1 Tax=Tolypocladium capitatum TaxID=45235 RepID=A0A2K3QAQ3_9HYPO|nr:Export control protein chs7 [Tolypocladium capitatum]
MRPSPRQQPPRSPWGQRPLATSMYVESSQAEMSPPIAGTGRLTWSALQDFCKDSTLPVCNLLSSPGHDQNGPWGGCQLTGIPLSGGRHLGNLGSILLCTVAIAAAAFMVLKSEKKRAAVGRREMQLFLLCYIIISICEIFSVGVFPLNESVRIAFTAIHIGMIIAATWILMLNAVVGYQLIDDGTPLSMGLMLLSAAALFIGTGYIALDTGFQWTGYWNSSYQLPNRNIALYVLYQLVPLIFLVAFFVLETILVLRVLGEVRPMIYLAAAAVLFALGQVFNYAISKSICDGTSGRIDGALFETLFTLLSVVMVWVFWSSITEDDWPMPSTSTYP